MTSPVSRVQQLSSQQSVSVLAPAERAVSGGFLLFVGGAVAATALRKLARNTHHAMVGMRPRPMSRTDSIVAFLVLRDLLLRLGVAVAQLGVDEHAPTEAVNAPSAGRDPRSPR